MYTPIIKPSDLTSHIYAEILYEITRSDASTIDTNPQALEAIQAACDEIKIYLAKYDIVQMFGDQPTNVGATWTPDSLMLYMVKTLSIWQLMMLGNANMYYETWQGHYNNCINTLKRVQAGLADPKWPLLNLSTLSGQDDNTVTWQSQPKRNNNF